MVSYIVAGLVLGGIYAIAASGLVLTYVSSGILNFGFGGIAFFVARFYYYLRIEQEWGFVGAGLVALVAAPIFGVLLYFVLFRFLRTSTTLVKVVVTIGLGVTIAPIASLIFGDRVIIQAPGLAPFPVKVYLVADVPVTLDQVIVFVSVLAMVVFGLLILRFSDVGLRVRAIVDSEAMTSLSGTSPTPMHIGVWAVSTLFAGLAGILAAPTIGSDAGSFTLLTAAAFAAVIVARLRSMPVAVLAGLGLGVIGALLQSWLPPESDLTGPIIASVPFAITLVFLLVNVLRGRESDTEGFGGPLDRAIKAPVGSRVIGRPVSSGLSTLRMRSQQRRVGLLTVGVLVVLAVVLRGFWVGDVALGLGFAIVFLSFTLVTGEGGMIWLCQATFAGVGAITAAQLVTNQGWPTLPAIFVGGLIAVPLGLLIGVLTIRIGNLYIALVTLTFGLLMERIVFSREVFHNAGQGVALPRPEFAQSDRAYAFLLIGAFCLLALVVLRLRRSTAGLALSAIRWSELGARTVGVSVLPMKLLVAGVAAFMAGVGGGFIAAYSGSAVTDSYATLVGMVWLAVLVTYGVRSIVAAVFAGLTLAFMPAIFENYLPLSLQSVPALLFGFGAILLARNPDGLIAMQARQLRQLFARRGHHGHPMDSATPVASGAPKQ